MTPSRGWWPWSASSQYPYYIVVSVNLRIFPALGTLYPRYHCSDGSKVFALREKGGTLWGWLYFPKHPRRYQISSYVCTLFAFQSTRLHDHRYYSTRKQLNLAYSWIKLGIQTFKHTKHNKPRNKLTFLSVQMSCCASYVGLCCRSCVPQPLSSLLWWPSGGW